MCQISLGMQRLSFSWISLALKIKPQFQYFILNTHETIIISYSVIHLGMQVLRKFHRKVHPEDTINAKSVTKSHKDKIKNLPRECFDEHCEINWNPPQDDLCCSGSTGNNEHWIKTDAECKYYISLESNYSSTKIW